MRKYLPRTTFQKKDLDKRTTQKVVRGLPKLLFFLLLISFLIPLTVKGIVKIENPLEAKDLGELVLNIIRFIRNLAIVGIGPIMIIIAGFYFITAAGDPEKINIAKKMLLWTLVGILIILSAEGFVALIKTIVGTVE